nr:Chain A, RUBREDOXIN [Guillardia theta]
MEIDEGKYECEACGYIYEPEKGDKFAGIPPGTPFVDLSDSFMCPACRSPKNQFKSIKKVIAGFAENQKYG